MATMEVVVVDKAVSTEDLGLVTRDIHLEVARLEAMLNTLVENKVESMKADKEKEKSSKQRITSTSTTASSTHQITSGRRHRHHNSESRHHTHRHKMSPNRSRTRKLRTYCEHGVGAEVIAIPGGISGDEDDELMDEAFDFLTYQDHRDHTSCPCPCPCPYPCHCSCQDNHNGQTMKCRYDDDYVSITMDVDLETMETMEGIDGVDVIETVEDSEAMLRRARRKRRRKRRKRRRRQRLAAAAAIQAAATRRDTRKTLDADDLPQRARWTIVATACLLLLMCLLLVGVTLRMAPIIDDMVRKENEELMNSLQRGDYSGWNTTTTTTPAPVVAAVGTGP